MLEQAAGSFVQDIAAGGLGQFDALGAEFGVEGRLAGRRKVRSRPAEVSC